MNEPELHRDKWDYPVGGFKHATVPMPCCGTQGPCDCPLPPLPEPIPQ